MFQSQKFAQVRQSELSSRINRSRSAPGTVSRFLFGDNDDSIDDARDIGRLSKRSSFEDGGRVSDGDPDYYRFSLRRSGNLKFNVRNQGDESIRFSIVDSRDRTISVNGRRLFADVDSDDREEFGARLNQGTYFIRIETSDGNNESYRFRLRLNSQRNSD